MCTAAALCHARAVLQAALNQVVKNFTCEWAKEGVRAVALAPW
jgi:hypothetical protein